MIRRSMPKCSAEYCLLGVGRVAKALEAKIIREAELVRVMPFGSRDRVRGSRAMRFLNSIGKTATRETDFQEERSKAKRNTSDCAFCG